MSESNTTYHYGGGWYLTRLLFAIVGVITIIPRYFQIKDLFNSTDMRFASGIYTLSKYYEINVIEAYLLCTLSIIGLMLVCKGGKFFHLGFLIWILSNGIYLISENLNIKAFDRLTFFIAVTLFFSPAYKNNLLKIKVPVISRKLMLVLFSSLYLSTGTMKLLYEPGWINGDAIRFSLNHQWHAGGPLALWVSTIPLLCFLIGISTVIFEILAGVFIWSKHYNHYIIIIGIFFHLGIALLMDVGAFSYVTLSAYPILLNPDYLESKVKKLSNKGSVHNMNLN